MTVHKISGWLSVVALFLSLPAVANAQNPHSQTIDNAAYSAEISDGWLVKWVNKRTGETFDFGKPENAASLSSVYQPGFWPIPGYGQENQVAQWKLQTSVPEQDALQIVQQLDVPNGLAQTVQWSLRLPLDKIDASYWPTGLTGPLLSKDSTPGRAVGPSYYLENRNAIISSHSWRQRYYAIQGKKGGLVIYVDDPELEHFSVLEMNKDRFPHDVVVTHRSIGSSPWSPHYQGSKWKIVQYEGAVTHGAEIYQKHLVKAYDLKPIEERPTAWVNQIDWTFVRAPFTTPPLTFPKSPDSPDYTEHWEENLKLVDQWLENLSKVLEPNKVMFYVNWWRYYAHDTMFPEHSVDPFFALSVGKARRMGYHVMLHFHNHLVQDATAFYGRYVAKQDEWHRAAYPNRPTAIGDPEGKIPWGVGYDFIRRMEVVQNNKNFGTKASERLGLPIRMTGYHMSPGYEGWRYMKVAEILSAVRATGADAVHLDVPAVWPEGKERYGINSQQGSREFYKLLRKTLDENGLENVAIATEATPGEGYMRYVDMAQLVRGLSNLNLLNGLMVETMIELQLGNDLEKANQVRAAATMRYANADAKKLQSQLRFNKDSVAAQLAKMRDLGEPNIDAVVIAPFVRAYPHLGAATPTMGGYPGDPNAAIHNRAAQVLHTWETLRRGGSFSCSPSLQMFMDKAPWNAIDSIKAARKESIKRGIRAEGLIFNNYSYGEFALARYWEKYQPQFAPAGEWERQDTARYRQNDGRVLTVRRSEPLTLNLSVNGTTLADINIFEGWKNNEALMKEFGPEFLLDQIDSKK